MSRYTLPHPDYEIVVGWDHPLNTFFGYVCNRHLPAEQDQCLLWVGTHPDAVPTVAALAALLEEVLTIPGDILRQLASDQRPRQPRTALQDHMLRLLRVLRQR